MNGANGISLVISERFCFLMIVMYNKYPTESTAPTQNANISADIPLINPSNNPIPIASFPSPKPIHAPSEISHKTKNGIKNSAPETRLSTEIISTVVLFCHAVKN